MKIPKWVWLAAAAVVAYVLLAKKTAGPSSSAPGAGAPDSRGTVEITTLPVTINGRLATVDVPIRSPAPFPGALI